MAIQKLATGTSIGTQLVNSVNGLIDSGVTVQALADAVAFAESGNMSTGGVVETNECNSGTGIGGNKYQLVDGVTARPADDGGSVIHVAGGSGFLYLEGLFLDGQPKISQFGCIGDGSTSDSSGFQSAVNKFKTVYVERTGMYYKVGGVTIPSGVTLIGERVYVYQAYDLEDIEGKGAIVYDTNEDTFITWAGQNSAIRCMFFGVDRSRPFLDTGSGGNVYLFMTSVFRCSVGFGRSSSVITGNSRVILSHFCANTIGISALTDSQVTNCEINANELHGVSISSGANDTVYMGNKVEWNKQKGYTIYGGQTSNEIIGGIVDRNGHAGIDATSGAGVNISGVKLKRNGALAPNEEQNTHIALRGVSGNGLKISGISTSYGYDDDGTSGNLSPKFSVVASDNPSVLGSLTDSNLDGATDDAIKARNGGSVVINTFNGNTVTDASLLFTSSNITINASSGNFGYYAFGEQIRKINTGTYSASENVVFDGLRPVSNFSTAYYQLDILTRNATNGGREVSRFIVAVGRNSGGSSITTEQLTTSTILSVTFAVNPDGSEITITLDPNSNNMSSTVILSAS